ncbi:MAG: GDP-mannose 4,6-dehydratase [Candidatus Hodarchaeota archaeon]
MKNIIITGSNGFLGSHLIDFCLKKKCVIYALDRPSASFKNLTHYTRGRKYFSNEDKLIIFGERIQLPSNNENLIFIECDIKNANLLDRIIAEVKPELIFHFAAQPYILPSWKDPVDTIETNVIGTINIFEPIKKYKLKPRVILACTSAEFGTTANEINRPLKEDDPLLAVHPYGISKIASELLARQYFLNFGIEGIILRFFNQTGPRKQNDACSEFVSKIAQIELGISEPIIEVGNLDTFRDITGIKDTLQAIWLVATKGKPGETYNVCSGRKSKIRDILNIIISFSSKKIKVIENIPKKLRKTDEDMILGDNAKIKSELGFEITQPIEVILKNMYEYWLKTLKET